MESSVYPLASFLAVFALAIITPGPNFVLVVNSAVADSRRHGLLTACGIATGSLLFSLAGLFGLLLVVFSWPPLAVLLSYLGGAYLAWLGLITLCQAWRRSPASAFARNSQLTLSSAYRRGLLTNLTNPKAWAFYLSLFSLVMTPQFLLWGKLLLALTMFLISLAWYVLVALLMTSRRASKQLQAVQPAIQLVLGLALLGLAGKVLLVSL